MPLVTVEVPEWGGSVWVRMLSGLELETLETRIDAQLKAGDAGQARALYALIVGTCLVDQNGQRLFDTEDSKQLASLAGPALKRIAQAASRLNGILESDVDSAKKNSSPTPAAAAASDLSSAAPAAST